MNLENTTQWTNIQKKDVNIATVQWGQQIQLWYGFNFDADEYFLSQIFNHHVKSPKTLPIPVSK